MENFAHYIYLVFGVIILAASQRYEYGILNYSVTLNYTLLSLLGLEYLKLGIVGLTNICVHYIKWLCDGDEGNYLLVIAAVLMSLLVYDSASVFITNKYYHIVLQKFLLIASIYGWIFANSYGYVAYYMTTLSTFNIVILLIERIVFRSEFKFGAIHPRYVYAVVAIYMLYITLTLVNKIVLDLYDLHHFLLLVIFNYHFQLNLFYKLSCWEYCTFIRSGIIDRIALIIDYYEVPSGKI